MFADVGTYTFGSDPDTTGTVLAVAGFDAVIRIDARTARILLDVFAREARLAALYGHPMLFVVESTATDLGPVGGTAVLDGPVWDVEPDPPDPFHPGDLVEHVLRVYVPDPADYVTELRGLLGEFLAPVGRWQLLPPVPISDERAVATAAYNARVARPAPLPPGSRLWEVRLGVRGEGDRTVLGDDVVHLQHDAGLHFDGMFSRFYPVGSRELGEALERYPDLRDPSEHADLDPA